MDASSEVIDEAQKQLDAYFRKKRSTFDLPLLMVGTPFQKLVWEALLQIPYGRNSLLPCTGKTDRQ